MDGKGFDRKCHISLGTIFPLEFREIDSQSYTGVYEPTPNQDEYNALWEVDVWVEGQMGDLEVRRNIRTACAISPDSAHFDGSCQYEINDMPSQEPILDFQFSVELLTEGRYELRGLLTGSKHHEITPIAIGQTARWLPRGMHILSLHFRKSVLDSASCREPFFIQNVQLLNQGELYFLDEHPGIQLDHLESK